MGKLFISLPKSPPLPPSMPQPAACNRRPCASHARGHPPSPLPLRVACTQPRPAPLSRATYASACTACASTWVACAFARAACASACAATIHAATFSRCPRSPRPSPHDTRDHSGPAPRSNCGPASRCRPPPAAFASTHSCRLVLPAASHPWPGLPCDRCCRATHAAPRAEP